jgi:hypothetical protein
MRFLLVLIVLAVLVALVVKTILVNRRAAEPERASPCEDLEPAAHTGRPRRPRRGDLVDRRRRFSLM